MPGLPVLFVCGRIDGNANPHYTGPIQGFMSENSPENFPKILSIRYPLGRKSFLFHLTHYLPIDMAEENIYRLIQARKDEIARVAREYGASRIRIFGSVARHTADNGSDIDFLVDLAPDRTLFDLGGLAYDLEQLLGRPVDVCTVPLLREPIRTRVIEEAIPL